MSAPPFTCATAPGVAFASREDLHEHYKSEWHRYNLRRRAAGLGPIDRAVFDRVRAAAEAQAQQESAAADSKKRDHVKQKEKSAASTAAAPGASSSPSQSSSPSAQPVSGSPVVVAAAAAAPIAAVQQSRVPAPESLPEEVAKAVAEFAPNALQCMFCREHGDFADVAANLEHMLSAHGFHIPDMAAVVDVEGMINYCAEKVQVGRICLYCDKGFASGDACVDHMVAKAHCRLAWEFEDQVDEFTDFYDFSRIVTDEDRGTMQIDEVTGELVLTDPDGAVRRYGPSRDFQTVYRQVKEQSRPVNVALQAQSNERALQLYRQAGVATSSALVVSSAVRHRLVRAKREKRDRAQRRMGWELHNSMQQNWLQKHAVAGTNVGAGHGVHG